MKPHQSVISLPTPPAPKSIRNGSFVNFVTICIIAVLTLFATQGCGPAKPSSDSVEGAVASHFEKMGFKVTNYSTIKTGHALKAGSEVIKDVQAAVTATPLQNLYEVVDTANYVRHELKADPVTSTKIATILTSAGAKRLLDTANVSAQDPLDLGKVVLMRKIASPGDTYVFKMNFAAGKDQSGWAIDQPMFSNIAPALPEYQRGFAQDNNHYEITNPADVEKLRSLLAQNNATLAALHKAAQTLLEQAVAQLPPGAIFTGTLTGNTNSPFNIGNAASGWDYGVLNRSQNSDEPLGITVQMLESNTTAKTVSVLLRTSNSWSDTRTADGVITTDSVSYLPMLTLTSDSDAALKNTGPITGDMATIRIPLIVKGDMLSAKIGKDTLLQLTRVPDTNRDTAIAKLKEREEALRKSIAENSVYIFNLIGADSRPPEKYLMRIGKLSSDGTFELKIENTQNSLVRFFIGTLDTNAFRSKGFPLRISSATWVEKAHKDTLLGTRSRLSYVFQYTDINFSGHSDNAGYIRNCTLTPANEETVAKIVSERDAARDAMLSVIKTDATYDGVATKVINGNIEDRVPIRIHLTKVAPDGGEVVAVLDQIDQPTFRRQLVGSIDFDTNSIIVKTIGQVPWSNTPRRTPWTEANNSSFFKITWTKEKLIGIHTLYLSDWGSIWKIEFPIALGCHAHAERQSPRF